MVRTPATETRERILAAAEQLLRRHGPAKVGMVDVARAAGMSHTNVYKHFGSIAEINQTVTERWLNEITDRLENILKSRREAPAKLKTYILALIEAKQQKLVQDPELYETYTELLEADPETLSHHLETVRTQIAAIIREGVTKGIYRVSNPDKAAAAVLAAITRFRHPVFVRAAGGVSLVPQAEPVIALLNAGLTQGVV